MFKIIYTILLSIATTQAYAESFQCADSEGQPFLSGTFNADRSDIMNLTVTEAESVKMLANVACDLDPAELGNGFKFKAPLLSYTYTPEDNSGFWSSLLGSQSQEDEFFGWATRTTFVSVGYLRYEEALDNNRDLCFHSAYLLAPTAELNQASFRFKFTIKQSVESDDPTAPYKKELLNCTKN